MHFASLVQTFSPIATTGARWRFAQDVSSFFNTSMLLRPPARPWRVIAEEFANASDPKRIKELSTELNDALKEHPAVGRLQPDQSGQEKQK